MLLPEQQDATKQKTKQLKNLTRYNFIFLCSWLMIFHNLNLYFTSTSIMHVATCIQQQIKTILHFLVH